MTAVLPKAAGIASESTVEDNRRVAKLSVHSVITPTAKLSRINPSEGHLFLYMTSAC